MTEVNNQRFSAQAAAWDSNTDHVRTCDEAVKSIMHHVPAFVEGKGKGIIAMLPPKYPDPFSEK